MVEVRGLIKRFGPQVAVDDLTCLVPNNGNMQYRYLPLGELWDRYFTSAQLQQR
jgi:hypothetical protein